MNYSVRYLLVITDNLISIHRHGFGTKSGLTARASRKTNNARYEVHENGVLKVQDGAPYYYIEGQELDNLLLATNMYYERVAKEIYKFDAATGKTLAA